MNNLFLCNDQVGFDICQWLIEQYRDDIGLVVTIGENEVWQTAVAAGINCLSITAKHQLLDAIRGSDQDYEWGFLVWWPWIIGTELIKLSKYGFINTHPSLLPYNRGKHYNFWALVEQVPFGVSLHFVEEGIDCGDVIAQLPIPYGWEDNGATLYESAARAMVKLFKDTYPHIREGRFTRTPQDLSKGSFHHSNELEKASKIDLETRYTARRLLNLLRARTFPGYPACWFEDDGQVFEVRVDIRRKTQ